MVEAINLVQSRTFSHRGAIAQYAAVEALSGVRGHLRQFARVPQGCELVITKLKQAEGPSPYLSHSYASSSCARLIGKRTTDVKGDTDSHVRHVSSRCICVTWCPGGFLASPYIRISHASSLEDLTCACDLIITACAALP
ncbi:aspartate aminotransferase [Bradyrhizobium cajani]|uniref:Aspartate aminotransferase n=1 Tax=Bradyrhizobium cajani TaxID=1928661 RepID=A0A844TAR6_9BRAD|nr:aspartate aminotransferase [Bradyrhizobium cajani]MCP3368637.1 aspartate aminotransferase [Bradyrhizobium cajani]MVT73569.1 aspartate aminotransferase [Bradyrhizobium cajani]